jgi:hypothetical protein
LTAVRTPEARQFDFWIGNWVVHGPDGSAAGRNRIESILGGAALRESWQGESGHAGTSLSGWDPDAGVWRQAWVDANGSWLLLEGGLAGDAMVLEGERPLESDKTKVARHRVSWSIVEGDPSRLRQHWEVSEDGGASWGTVFDGRYTRS